MRVGDVVRLKSGGPAMTVESMIGGSECFCVWFEGTTLKRRPFPTEALSHAGTESKGLKDRIAQPPVAKLRRRS